MRNTNACEIFKYFQNREIWQSVFDVNILGTVMVTDIFLDLLLENNGKILNNASIAGVHYFTLGKSYAYAASKSAIIQFTRMLAKNYARKIRANCICPGIIDTPIYISLDVQTQTERIPVGRVGTADDVASVANFLVSDDADFINGAVIPIDGGQCL